MSNLEVEWRMFHSKGVPWEVQGRTYSLPEQNVYVLGQVALPLMRRGFQKKKNTPPCPSLWALGGVALPLMRRGFQKKKNTPYLSPV